MKFKKGADVYTVDDDKVGKIKMIVMTPQTQNVTHLVVEKGFLFKEDRVVPMEWIDYSSPDKVQLKAGYEDDDLVPFEERHYIPADEYDPTVHGNTEDKDTVVNMSPPTFYYYAPIGTWWSYSASPLSNKYITVKQKNVPDGALILETGANVVTYDGHHAGDVEQILTDPGTNRVTHFVISKGILLAEKKLIPAYWVMNTAEAQVDLSVNKRVLENLPEFAEA